MYGDFTVLRTAVEDDARPPAFSDLLGRAGRVRRRRITVAALGVGLLALAAFSLVRPVRDVAGPRPTPVPTQGPSFEVTDLAFTSAQAGYAVLGPCTADASCSTTRGLAVTRDGGRSWRRVTLPVDVGDDTSLLLGANADSVSLVVGDQRYISDDGGLHWTGAHWLTDGSPVESIPPGQSVTVFCPVSQARCQDRLAALDSVRGVQRPLVHQPALPPAMDGAGPGLMVGHGDALWAASLAMGGNLWLAHSPDRGRTWRELPGPPGRGWFRPSILSDPGSRRTYLVDWSTSSGVIDAVWRLDDANAGVWTAVTPTGPAGAVVRAQVLPGGELRYTDIAGHTWDTDGAGTEVAPAPKAQVDGVDIDVMVRQIVGGVLVGTPIPGRRGDRVLFSADSGRHWQVRRVQF
ncbi:MAG TPA: hypothetical protein VFX70_05510 [Mycobacteriales bacterium]|nr:hypothetical protein [Mycobacteriales bacterium]